MKGKNGGDKTVEHVCCVDSVNGAAVRLVIGEDGGSAHTFPLSLFPRGIKEGDWLRLSVSIDGGAAEKAKNDIDDLYRQLTRGVAPGPV